MPTRPGETAIEVQLKAVSPWTLSCHVGVGSSKSLVFCTPTASLVM